MIRKSALLFSIILCFMGSQIRGEEIPEPVKVVLSNINLSLPLKTVRTVYLYDFTHKENLIGVETPFFNIPRWNLGLTFGAVTTFSGDGTPFLGLDITAPERLFYERFSFGVFFGYDFNQKERRTGLRASILLW